MKNILNNYHYDFNKDFGIDGNYELNIKIQQNDLNIEPNNVYRVIARKERNKRGFIFASKIIGKYFPTYSYSVRVASYLLAYLYLNKTRNIQLSEEKINRLRTSINEYMDMTEYLDTEKFEIDSALFIGVAECGIGVAHSMYSLFKGNIGFIHSVRYNLQGINSTFRFEEEHLTTASVHNCYTDDEHIFEKYNTIIICEDEITTGKTSLNLIKAINIKYPNKNYVLLSFLDWRNEDDCLQYKKIQEELNIKIETMSLIKGEISYKGYIKTKLENNKFKSSDNSKTKIFSNTIIVNEFSKFDAKVQKDDGSDSQNRTYIRESGMFGLTNGEKLINVSKYKKIANLLNKEIEYNKILCIGLNEFMYIPARISAYMKEKIDFCSTTRIATHINNKEKYEIKNALMFHNPYDNNIINYIYNVLPNTYKQVFMFVTSKIPKDSKEEILKAFTIYGIKKVTFVVIN